MAGGGGGEPVPSGKLAGGCSKAGISRRGTAQQGGSTEFVAVVVAVSVAVVVVLAIVDVVVASVDELRGSRAVHDLHGFSLVASMMGGGIQLYG